jgi:hypothetical protein
MPAFPEVVPATEEYGYVSQSQKDKQTDEGNTLNKLHVLDEVIEIHVRFQVVMTAGMKVTVSWDVMPCSLVEVDQFQRYLLPPSSGQ